MMVFVVFIMLFISFWQIYLYCKQSINEVKEGGTRALIVNIIALGIGLLGGITIWNLLVGNWEL